MSSAPSPSQTLSSPTPSSIPSSPRPAMTPASTDEVEELVRRKPLPDDIYPRTFTHRPLTSGFYWATALWLVVWAITPLS